MAQSGTRKILSSPRKAATFPQTFLNTVIDKGVNADSPSKNFLRRFLPKTIRQHSIRNGPLKGMLIYTSWHDYPRAILGYAEPKLTEWFQAHVTPKETWIDVGAYHGYTSIALSRLVGDQGRVVAFEPQLGAASCLARTKAANRLRQLQVVPLALGDSTHLNFLEGTNFHGMLQKQNGAVASEEAGYSALTIAFDSFWSAVGEGDSEISGIKLDVQGFEIAVIRGMLGVLKKYRPKLIIELHAGVDRTELLDLVAKAGYSREAVPIEPLGDEAKALFLDDRNYQFLAACRT